MLLQQYAAFFNAGATAAAALVGLLFVALSIDADLEKESHIKQFALTETAFISLGGIFIVSLLALLPSGLSLIAGTSIIFSIIGIAGLWRLHGSVVHVHLPLDYFYIFLTISLYVLLAGSSLWILITNGTTGSLNVFCVLLIALFGLSLIRAWRALKITKHHKSK